MNTARRVLCAAARHRFVVKAAADVMTWALALVAGGVLRYDFTLGWARLSSLVMMVSLGSICALCSGILCGLYRGRARYGSLDEVGAIVRSAFLTGCAVFALDVWGLARIVLPRGGVAIATVLALAGMGGLRYAWRLTFERGRRPRDPSERVIVFGAGEGGKQALNAMLHDPDGNYLPVALLDDDPYKRNLRLAGVHVEGVRHALSEVAARHAATTLLIAIPTGSSTLISEMTSAAQELGLTALTLPPVRDLFASTVDVTDFREVTDADLLGRHQIETDLGAIAGYLRDRRVLVTGAGGSIGAELCRQITLFGPAELIMLDRDESALHEVQLSLKGRALLDSNDLVLADIRDRGRIEEIMRSRRPAVVFHAAALKHLPLLERYPAEAIKTNVLGTRYVLEASAACGVELFINISTDKAADPISALGYSKRATERLTAWFAEQTGRTYVSVRFGNVLRSRGSVLGSFHAQISAGGPVTVTDPEVTRYFMTVQEAVQLVIQAGAVGRPGEVLVLDMGRPVRIADLAKLLIGRSGRTIDIVFTGLRPGEKRHETLFGSRERGSALIHPLISHVAVPPLSPEALACLDLRGDRALRALQSLAYSAPVEERWVPDVRAALARDHAGWNPEVRSAM
ncbi:MAG: polysaccharide biosynthesis protein [Mycobacteriales bacterium]